MNSKLYEKITVSHSSDAKSSYLMMQIDKNEELYKHQIATLAKNPIHSILQFKLITKDDSAALCYDITSKQTLAQTLKRKKFSRAEVTDILLKISRVIIGSDNFYLYENNFLLSEDYVYINPATLEISLVYIPIKLPGKQLNTEFCRLANRLIATIDNSGVRNIDFVQKTLVEINSDSFNLSHFAQYLSDTIVSVNETPEPVYERKASFAETPVHVDKRQIDAQKNQPEPKRFKLDAEQNNRHSRKEPDISYLDNDNKELESKKKKTMLVILVQILIVIGIALVVLETNLIINQARRMDSINLIALFLLAGIADYFVVTKLLRVESVKDLSIKSQQQSESKIPSKPVSKPLVQERKKEAISDRDLRTDSVKREIKPSSGDFATELISSEAEEHKQAYLSYLKDGKMEKKRIDSNPFIVGKLAEQTDFVINSNSVSRVHAEIQIESHAYYVVDLNSKNGTFLNGKKLQSNTKYQLKNNDQLSFAREEYIFIQ